MARVSQRMELSDVAIPLGFGVVAGLAACVGLPIKILLGVCLGLAVVFVLTHFGRIGQLGPYLFLAYAFVTPMNALGVSPDGTGIEINDFLLAFTVGVYILIRLREGRKLGPPTYRPIAQGLAVLGAGMVVGAIFGSTVPFIYRANATTYLDLTGVKTNLLLIISFAIGTGGPIGLYALARPSRLMCRRLMELFVLGQCASTVIGLLFPSLRYANRVRGLAIHPGQFGSLGVLALGAAIGLCLSREKPPIWTLPVFGTLGLGIVMSGSRAALGGLVLLIGLVCVITRRRWLIGGLMTGLAVGLAVIALGFVKIEGENALARSLNPSSFSSQISSEGREDLVSRTFHRWLDRPLTGNGINMMRSSHNVYIGILASAGVIGAAGFAQVISTLVRRAWRRSKDMLFVCATLGYVGYLGAALFDNILYWRWIWFYIGLLTALSATVPRVGEAQHDPAEHQLDPRDLRPPAVLTP